MNRQGAIRIGVKGLRKEGPGEADMSWPGVRYGKVGQSRFGMAHPRRASPHSAR